MVHELNVDCQFFLVEERERAEMNYGAKTTPKQTKKNMPYLTFVIACHI